MNRRHLIASAAASMASARAAAQAPTPPARPQFLYMLRLPPRLHDDAAWTETDRKTVAAHFAYLKQATADGQVLLAGRTDEPLAVTFGLVVFEAADSGAARAFMMGDPAVAAGVMLAELHPYQVALQR